MRYLAYLLLILLYYSHQSCILERKIKYDFGKEAEEKVKEIINDPKQEGYYNYNTLVAIVYSYTDQETRIVFSNYSKAPKTELERIKRTKHFMLVEGKIKIPILFHTTEAYDKQRSKYKKGYYSYGGYAIKIDSSKRIVEEGEAF